MSCSNCFNGCAETVSDQCVRYTGIDVPVLGIKTGDSLSYVEQALIQFLTSTLDGEGIKLTIDPLIICELISGNLETCKDLTLNNVISALIKSICNIDSRTTDLELAVENIQGPYTTDCLVGVTSTSNIHEVLQAVISKLCGLEIELTALALDLDTNYVKLSDLNSLIAAYIASIGTSTSYFNRMIPYTVVEYYGTLTGKFDVTGAGLGDWQKIYLCNGNNGTPDKRGRVPVGATSGMGGGSFNPIVDPGIPGNPAYALYGTAGSNSVVLTPSQIPSHSHSATASVTDPGHTHGIAFLDKANPGDGNSTVDFAGPNTFNTNSAVTNISVDVTVGSTGGGLGHSNFQPGLGCYYIMYIP